MEIGVVGEILATVGLTLGTVCTGTDVVTAAADENEAVVCTGVKVVATATGDDEAVVCTGAEVVATAAGDDEAVVCTGADVVATAAGDDEAVVCTGAEVVATAVGVLTTGVKVGVGLSLQATKTKKRADSPQSGFLKFFLKRYTPPK
ncbi:MAG: hypothetical protein WCS37_16505 [Chloroflexota bacterium]